jgi:hypothetical protein
VIKCLANQLKPFGIHSESVVVTLPIILLASREENLAHHIGRGLLLKHSRWVVGSQSKAKKYNADMSWTETTKGLIPVTNFKVCGEGRVVFATHAMTIFVMETIPRQA